MGQIFNRIKRITESYLNDLDNSSRDPLQEEDEDLRQTIDQLNAERRARQGARQSGSANGQSGSQNNKGQSRSDKPMDRLAALSTLGLTVNAGPEEIKKAYRDLIKQYHPDRVSTLGIELQELARKKTTEINKAYEYLTK